MILGWGSVEKVRRRVEKVQHKVHAKVHEKVHAKVHNHEIAAAACQLTPEKRPFLSSYVLMSVRRSKFEYILTLGCKYREGLLDQDWIRYADIQILDKIRLIGYKIR